MKLPAQARLPLLVLLGCCAASAADPLHAIAQGAFQHHESGWVFPRRVAGFERVGAPQDVDGSRDAVAYYAQGDSGARSTAVVDVYPKDSAAALTLVQAQAVIEREKLLASARKSRGVVEVGKSPVLGAEKVSFLQAARVTCLYVVASGEWRVRIRIDSAVPDAKGCDTFVRAQRWDSLGLAIQD